MSHPVTVLRTKEKVGRIVDILKSESHNGFPVVQDYDPDSVPTTDTHTDVSYKTLEPFMYKTTVIHVYILYISIILYA